jgi:hypothetical protein
MGHDQMVKWSDKPDTICTAHCALVNAEVVGVQFRSRRQKLSLT